MSTATIRYMVYNSDGISVRAFSAKAEADAYAKKLTDYHRQTFRVEAI